MKFCEKCYSIQKENAKFCNQCGNKLPCEIEAYTEADFEIKDGTLTKYTGDSECVKIPTTVNRIGRQAFCENKTLKSVIIPETVTVIMDNAFCGCENLTYVHLPSSLTMIGTGSFHGCEALKSIKIPESVTHINPYAFNGCYRLTEIKIPKNVYRIGSSAFGDCIALDTVYFNAGLVKKTVDSNKAFKNSGQIYGIKLIIGKDVREVPAYMFYTGNDDSNITSLEFEEGSICRVIRKCAFEGCQKLGEITLPNTVEEIQEMAFLNCDNIKITNLADVKRVDKNAFTFNKFGIL